MEKELKISAKNALAAYNNTNANGRELLEHLFGKELFAPKDIKEQVKTFEDACEALGCDHPLVRQYATMHAALYNNDMNFGNLDDVIAYSKLCIIVAALNEGWEPTFRDDECRYFPWFCIYTKNEYEQLDESVKKDCRVVGRAYVNAIARGGLACVYTGYASSYSNTSYGARLTFKTRELAEYCGKQFFDIWTKWLFV